MIAIEAHRLFDGTQFTPDPTVVLVEGNRILDVTASEAPLPAGCEVLRFPGATLLPGLIDSHVHLCGDAGLGALERLPNFSDAELTAIIERALGAHLASGVTTVRDLGDRGWAVIEWRDQHRSDATLPTVLGSGPPITSPMGHCWNMGGEAEGIEQLRRAVLERAGRGVDVVKIMASGGVSTPGTDAGRPQFTAEEIAAVVAESHAAGLPVTAHAHAVEAIQSALAAGVDGLEHCSFFTEKGIEIDAGVVATLVETAIPVCPTLGVAPGVSPPPAVLKLMRKLGLTYDDRVRIVAQMHRDGVRMVAGSDAGISPGKPHGILPEAVIHFSDGGVSTVDSLASATSFAAEVCGLADRKGHVRPGFDADLLVVDGDLATDITSLRNVQAVFLRGRRV